MTSLVARFAWSFSYFFVSVILGTLAMGLFWYYFPDLFVMGQRGASAVRDWIAAHAGSTRTESIVRFLLEDRQLLLITFVLITRLVLEILLTLALRLKGLFDRA
jgi:hypothetical protein